LISVCPVIEDQQPNELLHDMASILERKKLHGYVERQEEGLTVEPIQTKKHRI